MTREEAAVALAWAQLDFERTQRAARINPCPETLYELGRGASTLAAAEEQYREAATAPLAEQIAEIKPGSLLEYDDSRRWLDDFGG